MKRPKRPIDRLNELIPYIRKYQELAKETCDIDDIFQDNNGKLLQLLLVTGLHNMTESREGNDAQDYFGNEYEIKTCNTKLVSSFSTNHHLNQVILDKYRQTTWVFALYDNIELTHIYVMQPEDLTVHFDKWQKKIDEETLKNENYKGINNPKIPIKFVKKHGKLIYENLDKGPLTYTPIIPEGHFQFEFD